MSARKRVSLVTKIVSIFVLFFVSLWLPSKLYSLVGEGTVQFDAVGTLERSRCKATMISRWVGVTAAHCAVHKNFKQGFYSGPVFDSIALLDRRGVQHRFSIVKYQSLGVRLDENDLAVFFLSSSMPEGTIEPIPLAGVRPEKGRRVVLVGGACSNPRRPAEMFKRDELYFEKKAYAPPRGYGDRFVNRICLGDSGGPLIDSVNYKLLAVTSSFECHRGMEKKSGIIVKCELQTARFVPLAKHYKKIQTLIKKEKKAHLLRERMLKQKKSFIYKAKKLFFDHGHPLENKSLVLHRRVALLSDPLKPSGEASMAEEVFWSRNNDQLRVKGFSLFNQKKYYFVKLTTSELSRKRFAGLFGSEDLEWWGWVKASAIETYL